MIKGAIFDMDGTLVDNTPVHIRAFEIFCERYGIRDWKEKLGQAVRFIRISSVSSFSS